MSHENVTQLLDEHGPDDPILGVIPVIKRALGFLAEGDQDSAKCSMELALRKAKQKAKAEAEQAGHTASPVPGYEIADILGGADRNLGLYLASGSDLDRRGAIDDAMESARSLVDVLSAIDDDNRHIIDATSLGSISRLAWVAQGLIERAIELQRMEGGSDE